MRAVTHEGVRFYDAAGACVAEVRVPPSPGRYLAAEVFRDDAVIILIGQRLSQSEQVRDVLGRHTLWYDDGSCLPAGRT